MPRPIQTVVHLAALQHNLRQVRLTSPDAWVWAVVKANAYGHGIENVFPALRAADGFALLDLDEAKRLRDLGWRNPILLLEGVFEARDLELCSRLNLWHVVHCDEQIDMLAAHKTHAPHRVFLKMNSGMNRLGFPPNRFRSAWARLNALPQVDEISLMTHFANADCDFNIQNKFSVAQQNALFLEATSGLSGEKSISNSAAILRNTRDGAIKSESIRAGVVLYGGSPDFPAHSASDWQLLPAMTLSTRIIGVQHLQAGDCVGYGSTFVADKPMTIGIAACGYADGYPRHASNQTPVLVNGHLTHLVGRVSMDMLAMNLTHLSSDCAQVGAEVTLWGRSQNAQHPAILSIDDVAHSAQTIGYELMTALTRRVPVFVNQIE